MLSKKGIDEFAFVLIAGLVFIVIMLITWGTSPLPEENVTEEENITFPTRLSLVGVFEKDKTHQFWIGQFKVSYGIGKETLFTRKNIVVKKGLFHDKSIRFIVNIDESKLENFVTSAFLILEIESTNMVGDLLVIVNGQRVKVIKPMMGEVSVQIRKEVLSTSNVIEIRASSPGWKFWATNVYEISEMMFGVNVYGVEQKIYGFDVDKEEIENFKLARLEFELHDYDPSGSLIITLNGNIIYKGVPSKFFTKDFSLSELGLVEGKNTISFSVERDAYYEIDDAVFTIIYKEVGYKTFTKMFTVTPSEYRALKSGRRGKIKFNVEKIEEPGILEMRIKDAEGDVHRILLQQIEEGVNEATFDYRSVKEGNNKVYFSSMDGTFYISNVRIEI